MTLAPPPDPDRWSYIRTIAERPSIWRRMLSLVSLKRISRSLKQTKGFAQSANQFAGSVGAAAQMAGYNYLVTSAGAIGENRAGNQFNGNSAALDAIRGDVVEINERSSYVSQNLYSAGGLNGAIAHNDSYNFFKWDDAAECMVPCRPSTPAGLRFKRSFAAFMREWRRK